MKTNRIFAMTLFSLFSMGATLNCFGCSTPATDSTKKNTSAVSTKKSPPNSPTDNFKPPREPKINPTNSIGLVLENIGLVFPGTVIVDEKRDVYLVSNANVRPMENVNNGYISRISPNGKVLSLKWIEGGKDGTTLISPKGMAIRNDTLYVADVKSVRKFSLEDGSSRGSISIENASFLNDIALSNDGSLYVTDTGLTFSFGKLVPNKKDAIFTIEADDTVKPLISDPALKNPNGIIATSDGLVAASYSTSDILLVTFDGQISSTTTLPSGKLDGIVQLPSKELLVTSWQAATVFKGTMTRTFAPFLTEISGPSDLSYDTKRHRVIVPVAGKNALLFYPLDPSSKLAFNSTVQSNTLSK